MAESPKGPLVESPVRLEGKADFTYAVGKVTDTVADFVERVVMPVPEALARLMAGVVDRLRGPYQEERAVNIGRLNEEVKALQAVQGVENPKALPPKVVNQIVEDGSYIEDDELRRMWAQLIVNAQAGMPIDAYLVEVLGKLDGEDVQILKGAPESLYLEALKKDPARLLALALIREELGNTIEPKYHTVEFLGYSVTPLGELLLKAVAEPKPPATPG